MQMQLALQSSYAASKTMPGSACMWQLIAACAGVIQQ
jgi:hypothetical protein